MNCKKCGRVLRAGDTFCPYCGTAVSASGGSAGSGFNWNLANDSPKPGPTVKKPDIRFDWNMEKPVSADAGMPVTQQESRWSEPEEAKQLFTFDKEHAALQKQVDQKVDKIAAERPAPAVQRERREDLFVLPSDMTMDDFSDLLGESLVRESKRVLVVNPRDEEQQAVSSNIYQADPLGDSVQVSASVPEIMPEQEIREPENPVQESPVMPDFSVEEIPRIPPKRKIKKVPKQRSAEDRAYDPFTGKEYLTFTAFPGFLDGQRGGKQADSGRVEATGLPKQPVPSLDFEKLQDLIGGTPAAPVKEQRSLSLSALDPGYTPEEEKKAIESFQSLIKAEESFTESVNQFVYLSGEEEEKAEQAYRRREELSLEPKSSFISIDDEYQKYRQDHEPPAITMLEVKETDADPADTLQASGQENEQPETLASKKSENPEKTDLTEPVEENSPASRPSAEKSGKVARIVRKSSRITSLETEEPANADPEEGKVVRNDSPDKDAAEASEIVTSVTASSKEGKKKSRELNIKINEPSGTQYTVRTEEINLADKANRLKDTQEVDLERLKEGPKSVRVQVEVNRKASSSSVEVTRADDGSTVVKTVEEGEENEHRYDAKGDNLPYRRPEEESFWEKNEVPATRLTATDIFSSELKDFRDRWEEEEQQRKTEGAEEDLNPEEDRIERFLANELKNSGTLIEMAEESAPLTEEENGKQTETDEVASDASPGEEATDTDQADSPEEIMETEVQTAEPEEDNDTADQQEHSGEQEEEIVETAETAEFPEESGEIQTAETQDPETSEQGEVPEDTVQTEEQAETGTADTGEESEEPKAESTGTAEELQDSSEGKEAPEEETEDTEEAQGLLSSLSLFRHRIASVISGGEDEEEASEEKITEDPEIADETEEDETEYEEEEGRWSAASIMSVIIVVLIIAIVIEFAVIGVKLFAPNSQGAVLIKRIEQTVSGKKPNFVIESEARLSDGSIVEFPDDSV